MMDSVALDVRPRSPFCEHSQDAYAALLGALEANPGASTAALSRILNVGKGSIVARCARLARRGALAKRADGHWRVAAEPRWIERPEPARGDRPFPPWVSMSTTTSGPTRAISPSRAMVDAREEADLSAQTLAQHAAYPVQDGRCV